MSSETPVIIEAAINGGSSKRRNPNVPREPSEIVDDTYRCLDAGASIIHAHNADYQLTGKAAADNYLEAWRVILDERPGTLWYPTLSGGRNVHEVLEHIAIIAREVPLRIGVVDPGSTNLGRPDDEGLPIGVVYNNSYDDQFSSLSVGILSKALTIEHAIRNGRRRYDFLKGAETYKQHLGGKPVALYRCRIGLS